MSEAFPREDFGGAVPDQEFEDALAARERFTLLVDQWRDSDQIEDIEPGGPADRSLELAEIIGDLGLGVHDISGGTTPMGTELSPLKRAIIMLLRGELDDRMAERVEAATRGLYVVTRLNDAA